MAFSNDIRVRYHHRGEAGRHHHAAEGAGSGTHRRTAIRGSAQAMCDRAPARARTRC